ncbi:very short patch repair endonuclease [Spiribacter sp. 221]|uniref:very short patch repair endonuclease n=1 Tax=Spiribacter onubensis TaxID=3122420 RepID=UPI00349F2D4F
MTDVLTPDQRSRVMGRIRGSNTKPELWVRRGLFALGFRYRLHQRQLPGTPDLVLPRYRAVIFVNGCFWHGHDCHLYRLPSTRTDFWQSKIEKTRIRDKKNNARLRELGWRVLIIWECALRGRTRQSPDRVLGSAASWLRSAQAMLEITGK